MTPLDPSKVLASRRRLPRPADVANRHDLVGEGGCGVVGLASSVPIAGRHLYKSLLQMRNRGNGKGGGIAAVGLSAKQLGVSQKVLEEDYLIQVAYLDEGVRSRVEYKYLIPHFDIHSIREVPTVGDYDKVGLEVAPPAVVQYFCRVKPKVLKQFCKDHDLSEVDAAEDEYVYQNTYKLNNEFYQALSEKQAFVLSHGKNLVVFKLVGYAEDAISYYRLEDFEAHVWIGHHRYPTKGAVWHPGGAHPFIGMHEGLVHNGDFSNYHSMRDYLSEHGISTLFLTDTEVAALYFDLLRRTYDYPLEYLIEAMAPTSERDFTLLPDKKQETYRTIQTAHVPNSPDGPWFFIIAANDPRQKEWELIGITDTSMLRPQVFALIEGDVQLGLVASERQAVDAVLESLATARVIPQNRADRYWNARGGSHTDGGAFTFAVDRDSHELVCRDKFSKIVKVPSGRVTYQDEQPVRRLPSAVQKVLDAQEPARDTALSLLPLLRDMEYGVLYGMLRTLRHGDQARALEIMTLLLDWEYDCGKKKPASVKGLIKREIEVLFTDMPTKGTHFHTIGWKTRGELGKGTPDKTLIVDAKGFPIEGPDALAQFLVKADKKDWHRFILYHLAGHRFIGCGFGAEQDTIRIDCYGNPGDYLGSGLDGVEVYVHYAGQDQLGQIVKSGKLVVHGDVGQTFLYGAKGGHIFVRGNAAGRPLINAVGKPKVVINGTALDYLAESFMAGDPLTGGGFCILNGVRTEDGRVEELPEPYPGGNLFSLASGGAIYVRDPHRKIEENQLNGGRVVDITRADWAIIQPMLVENERLFNIRVADLLTINGKRAVPERVYRKVETAGMGH